MSPLPRTGRAAFRACGPALAVLFLTSLLTAACGRKDENRAPGAPESAGKDAGAGAAAGAAGSEGEAGGANAGASGAADAGETSRGGMGSTQGAAAKDGAENPKTLGPGGLASAKDPGAVVRIGDQAVPYRLFERYLNDNAGEETISGESGDTIKSRLLDQFIEEQLLLRQAGRLKIVVSDSEVDAYLKELGLTEGDLDAAAPDGKEAFRDKIKNGLVIQKVKEQAVLKTIQVTPGEVDDAMGKHPDLARRNVQFVVRQILLDDKKTAEEIQKKVAADPTQFVKVAEEKSVAPDKGQPRSLGEDDLPPDLREAVRALDPGKVSPVLEYARMWLIVMLVRKTEATSADQAEARRRVESELFREKADQVMDRYLADLKEKTEIHVNRAILPFQYQGENKN